MSGLPALVLAGGSSSRFGSPKQLAAWQGTTLLRHAAKTALSAECNPVIVVLGFDAGRLRHELAGLPVEIVPNGDWQEGIASSIRAGLAALAQAPEVLITLCDQPAILAKHLSGLVGLYRESGRPIAACCYGEAIGVPAIFSSRYFPELLTLQGDTGARRILAQHPGHVALLDLPEAALDIDTPADLASRSPLVR